MGSPSINFNQMIKDSNQLSRLFKNKVAKILDEKGYNDMKSEERETFLQSEEILAIIQAASKNNFGLVEIANMFGYTIKELVELKRKYTIIDDSLLLGSSERDKSVELKLYLLAEGFYMPETTTFVTTRGDRTLEKKTIVDKYYPPLFNAVKMIVENKKKEEYQQKQLEIAQEHNKIHVVFEFLDGQNV